MDVSELQRGELGIGGRKHGDILDIRPRPCNHPDAFLFGRIKERLKVINARQVNLARPRVRHSPVEVDGNGIETRGLCFLYDISPERWDGETPHVEFAGLNKSTVSEDEETVVVPFYGCSEPVIRPR